MCTTALRGNTNHTEACRLEAIDGNIALITTLQFEKKYRVPGALTAPMPDNSTMKEGDVVVGLTGHHGAFIGRYVKKAGDRYTVRHWVTGPDAQDDDCMAAFPVPAGVAPYTYVAFEAIGGKKLRGFVLAVEGGKAFVRDGTGNVAAYPKTALRPLLLGKKDFKAGDAVLAYVWPAGFSPARVTKIEETGNVYSVTLNRERDPRRLFFVDLTDAL